MIDIKGLTTRFAPDQIGTFAAVVREREVDGAVGPIVIVVGPGPVAEQARAFSERGHLIRPIRHRRPAQHERPASAAAEIE